MPRTSKDIPGVEWVQGTGAFIRVRQEACTGCASCVKVCLGGCYRLVKKRARVRSLGTCLECGACWYVCPEGAIDFSWPRGGTGFRTTWG